MTKNSGGIIAQIPCNQEWHRVRKRLNELPPHWQAHKKIELLDLCRASAKLRRLMPYISLGRLCLASNTTAERLSDADRCCYFYQGYYVVSSYDNERKWFFENPSEAINFVQQEM